MKDGRGSGNLGLIKLNIESCLCPMVLAVVWGGCGGVRSVRIVVVCSVILSLPLSIINKEWRLMRTTLIVVPGKGEQFIFSFKKRPPIKLNGLYQYSLG
jgi:hypothetical protein